MKTALLVIDVQQALVDYLRSERAQEFLGIVAPLIERARAANLPIIYVQHQGEELVP